MNSRIIVLGLTLLASGCGGGGSGGSPPPANPATVATISVSPAEVTLTRGQSTQLSATLRDAGGQLVLDRSVTWQSEDDTTASVSASGLVQALRAGNATIRASVDGKIAMARVAVNEQVAAVSRVELDVVNARVEEGSSLQLRATAYGADGAIIQGRGEQWSSPGQGAIVDLTPTGLVTGLRAGVASVAVRIDGVQAAATITVHADYPHDLVYSSAPVGAHMELYSVDLRDAAAVANRVFPAGRYAAHGTPSPSGDRIAFVIHHGDDAQNWQSSIHVANRDGSGFIRLTFLPARNDSPSWSPDGSRIAFSSQPFGERADIWVMNSDGSGLANLTAGHADSTQVSPAWSPAMPGGERIAYTRRQGGLGQLWTMRPDGSDKRLLTGDGGFDDDEAAWSPDGQNLVFRRTGAGVFGDLYLVSSAGGAGRALMPHYALPFEQLSPAWSPDGRLIAFTSKHADGENHQVWTVWADGTRLAQRTFDAQLHAHPAWLRRGS